MDKNISFNNANSTNQIDLLYLTNMTTCKNNNEVKATIVDKKEVEFYKKRIFQLCKDMLRNKETPPTVKDSFDYFCVNAIEYFKMMDKTEMIQKEYKTLNHDTESPTSLPNHNNNPSELSEDVNALMFKKIAKKDDKLDKFVIKNVVKKNEMVIPEQKQYNLTDVKYQEKGVEVKAKTSMVAMNNKKKKNKRDIKKKIEETKQPKTKQPKTKQPKTKQPKTKQQRNVIDLNI